MNMSDQTTEQNAKACIECKAEMPFNAIKCVKCSAYQNWRRFVLTSSSSLAVLVALISVATFALPIWQQAIGPTKARPHFRVISFEKGVIMTMISNDGGSPVALGDLSIYLYSTGGTGKGHTLSILDEAANRLLSPGSIKIIRGGIPPVGSFERPSFDELIKTMEAAAGLNEYCRVEVTLLDLAGKYNSMSGEKVTCATIYAVFARPN
jgi:ribosomal protein L40E